MFRSEVSRMNKSILFFFLPTMFLFAIGCGDASDSGPFGAVKESILLSPFAGEWVIDFEKSLDAQKAAGASEEDIERLRKFYAENPQFGKMHPDMNITGDIAICAGTPNSEYRFFAMHQHGNKICGKAWHHEDRFDPGDMSKCYIRLMLKGDLLYLDLKMKDGLPDMNDPDFKDSLPIESGSAKECDAENPAETDWGEWMRFVFSRKK